MKTLSVSKLKATLSEQIRYVKAGEEVVVTERGRIVAKLVPVAASNEAEEEIYARLEANGVPVRRGRPLPREFWALPIGEDPTGSVLRAVLEERESGR